MQPMHTSAIMRQKSTERYRLTLPKSLALQIEAAAILLEERRFVKHTCSDALLVAMESVMKTSRNNVKIITRFYADAEEEMVLIKLRKDVKDRIYEEAKALKCSAKALIYAVSIIFMRAALASFWKNNTKDYYAVKSKFPDFRFTRKSDVLNLPTIKTPRQKHRKLTLTKDQTAMRHYNYMEEFKSFMDQFGGIDSWCNKNVALSIHTYGLSGNIGKAQDDDRPKEQNPYTIHLFRIWKRGRGYNITIHAHKESTGENPPSLEIGSVHRLYDIYRHIDWSELTTLQKDVQ